MNTLFLNENPLSNPFTVGSVSGKELRLRSAISYVETVHAVSLPGQAVETNDKRISSLEKKICIHHTIPWPYYLSSLILFVYGFYYVIRYKPKIIEAESPIFSGLAAVVLGKIFSIPVIVEVRASYDTLIRYKMSCIPLGFKQKLLRFVMRFVYKNSTKIIANSKTYQNQVWSYGYRSAVINPGLYRAPTHVEAGKRLNVICYMGRLVKEKGIEDLLRVVANVKSILRKEKWSVWIVGDGPLRISLEKKVGEFQVSDLVTFKGYQRNYQTLADVSLLVNPCYVRAPLEMVQAEAAWMRVPVICYGTRKIPETIQDKITGYVVPERNVRVLQQRVIELMLNPDLRKEMGIAGHAFAQNRFIFKNQVERLSLVYRSLIVR